MMSRWLLAAAAVLLTASPICAAQPSGARVYGSVWAEEETGDLRGMEVELRPGTPASAVVTWCEGECRGGKVVPVRRSGRRISFTVITLDGIVDRNGRPAKPLTTRYVGELSEGMLVLRSPDRLPSWRERLKRFPSPRPGQTAWLACGEPKC